MRFKMVSTTGFSGLGPEVCKLVDVETGEELGYVGHMNGNEVIHFCKPIPIKRLIYVVDQLVRQRSLSQNATEEPRRRL